MAVARDTSTYDSLKRTPSYSGSYSVSLKGNSTLSIEDVGTVDIGKVWSTSINMHCPRASINIGVVCCCVALWMCGRVEREAPARSSRGLSPCI